MAIEADEGGFSSPGFARACIACIADPWLASYVLDHGEQGDCDYCGHADAVTLGAHDLFRHMSECLQREHRPFGLSDDVPGAEWGIDATGVTSEDLLAQHGDPLSEELAGAFVGSFSDDWIARGVWTGDPGDWLTDGWDRFVREVKFERRFVFLRPSAPKEPFPGYEIEPSDMLDRLQAVLDHCGAVIPFPAGQLMVRGRKHHPTDVLPDADALGAPPPDKATSQRMSPPGISFFYAAGDEETALAELRGIEGEVATTSDWLTCRSSFIVDLARVPGMPSIFDETTAHMRPTIRFLHRFVREIAKPVVAHDNPDIDYVPTQVVAEFMRYFVTSDSGASVAGVSYPSAIKPGRTNYAFFPPTSGDDAVVKIHGAPRRHSAAEAITGWTSID